MAVRRKGSKNIFFPMDVNKLALLLMSVLVLSTIDILALITDQMIYV